MLIAGSLVVEGVTAIEALDATLKMIVSSLSSFGKGHVHRTIHVQSGATLRRMRLFRNHSLGCAAFSACSRLFARVDSALDSALSCPVALRPFGDFFVGCFVTTSVTELEMRILSFRKLLGLPPVVAQAEDWVRALHLTAKFSPLLVGSIGVPLVWCVALVYKPVKRATASSATVYELEGGW